MRELFEFVQKYGFLTSWCFSRLEEGEFGQKKCKKIVFECVRDKLTKFHA